MDKATKATEAAIVEKLGEWGKLEKQKLAVEAQLALDLAPHDAKYAKATNEIVAAAALTISELVPQLATLSAEIIAEMEAGCNAESGLVLLPLVSAAFAGKGVKGTAVAQVTSKPGPRVIDVGKFFALCLKGKRLSAFFSCITVGVTKAKELFGDHEVSTIAAKTTNHSVELKLSA